MGNSLLSILVLAGIAIFLILRLRSVLGTREGFEKPRAEFPGAEEATKVKRDFEVIEGGVDHDIIDNVEAGSRTADNLAAIKRIDPSFSVSDFLSGARGAYEMILMAFEHDDLDSIKPFLSEDVFEAFSEVVAERQAKGLTIESQFIGLRELQIIDADLDRATEEAEIKIRFVGEITSVVRNADGDIVEGDPKAINRQKDIWTFARHLGSDDPNWQLVATGA
ncbi:Tim44/TimA family putative adaptor protein [Celeribacter halophilus]|uniref:Predicted lipid-binding transport protein, Tim44 family n=1 Tax=Celeribacter halophilus TaxID=576117 RepID=A0A1I3TRX9_9RHOB|nr:Tim44/TimA family putative adaptor protein [Celeribacter halophilus]PZX10692.1 putative lipid-binding transport protein (Tim44 family) [Celeribacter halophilus]SFJ73089.1 Predicted lipid-binding transport protein, Tim44 family [Celeribacter halophilus]